VEDSQVEELKRWAEGLADDSRPELRAAAKAIQLLAQDLLAARSQLYEERLIRQALEAQAERLTGEVPHDLLERLRALIRRPLSRER
jgi:hypothetical protein